MWFESRRHKEQRELLEAGFRPEWRDLLESRMASWSSLDDTERARLEALALRLLGRFHWEGANGFEVTEDMMVTIASEAAMLLLGLPDESFDRVHTVLVHPTTLVLSGEHTQVGGVVSDSPMPILGQADQHGPVLIVWDAVLGSARHPESGHQVVFHEFAHRLDMLTGAADGTPPMRDVEQSEDWVAVCTAVYERVVEGHGGHSLRSYAGVNPAEFFAVASESFFGAAADAGARARRAVPGHVRLLRPGPRSPGVIHRWARPRTRRWPGQMPGPPFTLQSGSISSSTPRSCRCACRRSPRTAA